VKEKQFFFVCFFVLFLLFVNVWVSFENFLFCFYGFVMFFVIYVLIEDWSLFVKGKESYCFGLEDTKYIHLNSTDKSNEEKGLKRQNWRLTQKETWKIDEGRSSCPNAFDFLFCFYVFVNFFVVFMFYGFLWFCFVVFLFRLFMFVFSDIFLYLCFDVLWLFMFLYLLLTRVNKKYLWCNNEAYGTK